MRHHLDRWVRLRLGAVTLAVLGLGALSAATLIGGDPPGGRRRGGGLAGDEASGAGDLRGRLAREDEAERGAGAGGAGGAADEGGDADADAQRDADARRPHEGDIAWRGGGGGAGGPGGARTGISAGAADAARARALRERRRLAGSAAGSADGRTDEVPEEDDEDEEPVGTGLRADIWKLVDVEIHRFAQAPAGPPTITRVDPVIDFPSPSGFGLPFIARNIVVRWRGFLRAPEDGVYTIFLGSDDGSRLAIDGRAVLEVDHLQPYAEQGVEVALTRGYHAIDVAFFQNEGPAGCVLSWVPPGGFPEVVPQVLLFPAVPPERAPIITSVEPPRARQGQVVALKGDGFPEPAEPFEVFLQPEAGAGGGERRLVAHRIEDGSILATIPPGVAAGLIFLHVRETASQGFPYEVGDVFGLLGEYRPFEGEAHTLAEALQHPIAFARIEPTIDLPHRGTFPDAVGPVRFGATFSGSLYVAEGGNRRLRLTSDDGARLFVDGAPLVDLDGLHPMTAGEGEVLLSEGFHDIRIEHFQNLGGAGLQLHWKRGGAFELVPKGALYPPPGYELVQMPRIAGADPREGREGDEVVLTGEGFGFETAAARVTFGSVPAEVDLVRPDLLRVRVPKGAKTGKLAVQIGALLAEGAVDFTVLGRGLRAAYYRFEEDIHVMPNLDARAPDLERIDPALRFGEGYSFGLPYEAERFAALYLGEIEAPRDGEYAFSLWSDDGSKLYVGGALVVDHDGLHGLSGAEGRVALTAGRHDLRVEFFQNYGAAALDLHWLLPGARGWQRVPGAALFPD